MKKLIFISCIALSVFMTSEASAFWLWTPQTRKWVNPKYSAKDSPEEQMEFARSFFESKNYDKSIAEFRKLIRFYPSSRLASEAQYYIGRSYEEKKEHSVAFAELQKVIDNYPRSERVNEIIEREYHLGDLFYNGEKVKLAGVGIFPSLDKAIDIFTKVISDSPYGPYADMSQYKLGLCYNKAGRFDEARDAFQKVIDNYPNSKLQADAKYQLAASITKVALKSDYDQEQTREAAKNFEKFSKEFPQSELKSSSEEEFKKLREREAKQEFDIAEFYYKQNKSASAALYYEEVAMRYGDTSYAAKAAEKLTLIKKSQK